MTSQGTAISLKEFILDLDAKRIEAMTKRDIPTLSGLLADELSYVHSGGRNDNKQSFIDLIASPTSNYVAVDYSETEVIDCGHTAVLVRGIARLHLGVRPSLPEEIYSVLFSDMWVQRDQGWQMVAWHATRVPD